MIDDLQRDELGAEGHHVEVGPDGLVLSQHLRLDHTFPPPAREFEDRDPVTLGSSGHRILRNGQLVDTRNSVSFVSSSS